MMKLKAMILATAGCLLMSVAQAQSVRETIRLDKGWKFKLGHAADPQKDFGCGTEYFNYLTKANSIHNEALRTEVRRCGLGGGSGAPRLGDHAALRPRGQSFSRL